MARPIVHTIPPEAPCRSLATASIATLCPSASRVVANKSNIRPRRKGTCRVEENLSASIPAIGEAIQEAAAKTARRFDVVLCIWSSGRPIRSLSIKGSTGTMRPYRKRSVKAPMPTVKTINNGCERHLRPRGGAALVELSHLSMAGECESWIALLQRGQNYTIEFFEINTSSTMTSTQIKKPKASSHDWKKTGIG